MEILAALGGVREAMRSAGLRIAAVGLWSGILMAISAGPVGAVDVVNRDKVQRIIVLNESDGESNTVILKPQEKRADVCKDCVILCGNTSVEVSGAMTATIEGGKISIAKR